MRDGGEEKEHNTDLCRLACASTLLHWMNKELPAAAVGGGVRLQWAECGLVVTPMPAPPGRPLWHQKGKFRAVGKATW